MSILLRALRGVVTPLHDGLLLRGASSSSTVDYVVPWHLMQPVLNLEGQSEAVQGSNVESRARSAQSLLEKKQQSFLSE